ncbi:MAG: hypothetical protein R8K22_00250, partial [Mariprofundaceae bacterium]
ALPYSKVIKYSCSYLDYPLLFACKEKSAAYSLYVSIFDAGGGQKMGDLNSYHSASFQFHSLQFAT